MLAKQLSYLAGAESASGPQAALVASAARVRSSSTEPLGTSLSVGAQASWALDVWGQGAGETARARARQEASSAGWHEARVLVAAELVLETGAVSAEHVLNVLGRLNASAPPDQVETALRLNEAPRADTDRYDRLRDQAGQEVDHA